MNAPVSPDFAAVLRDIRSTQQDEADRIAELRQNHRELRHSLYQAGQRLLYADLDKDRRQWTESERDELVSAQEAFDEARNALKLFEAHHHNDLKVAQ